MNIDRVEKKLREAQFFLSKMHEQERSAFGDKEPVDFYLSAFLSAGRTVDYRLRHEQAAAYPIWHKAWNAGLALSEDRLIKFLVDDRNVEIHESGSGRGMKTEDIVVGNSYSDESGTLDVSGPAGARAIIRKPKYYFTIAGTERSATEACAEYLLLLGRMVATFKADHS